MINVQQRPRKRELLTTEEKKALNHFVNSQPSVSAAADQIGIHRNKLDLVLLKGSSSPETIGLIREALNKLQGAA